WHLWCAAALSGSAAVGAVAAARAEPELTALLSTAAVVFATAAGLLAVRSAPWPATVLLPDPIVPKPTAGFCMSVLLLRLVADRALLTAFTAAGGAATAAAGLANLAASPVTAGAALAALSTAALSVAPKLAVVTAGPEPAAAHSTLTGLVAGWSATAAAGGVTVAAVAGPAESSTILAALFAADLGGLLVLRTRSHVVVHRRIALGAAGSVSLLAAFTVTVVAAPVHAPWLCACAAVLCVLAVRGAGSPASPNPLAHRMIQVTEYAALVALVPLAFWVSGIYGLVRQLSLA
ncbi:ubiquitin family protein, partial [Mycolicibacterium vanbaalenii]|uniref:type VII secretion integral membrane protein EccD n=1 Tax=Mycolicibacterium vanbaalenii TaxID=110539 RepID=UPI0021F301C9